MLGDLDQRIARKPILGSDEFECYPSHSTFRGSSSSSLIPAVSCANSNVELNQCVVRGGVVGAHPSILVDGIDASQSHLIIRGDADAIVAGSTSLVAGSLVAHSIDSDNTSTLQVDPDVALRSPPVRIASGVTRDMALLSADADGGVLEIALRSAPGDLFSTFISLSGERNSVPGLGALWLDLPTFSVFDVGAIDATGEHLLSIPLPANHRGLGISLQAITSGSVFELTNATSVILE